MSFNLVNSLKLIEEQSKLSGMYDILNNVIDHSTPEYVKAKEIIDKQWKVVEELRKDGK